MDVGLIYANRNSFQAGLSILNIVNPTLGWDTGTKESYSRKVIAAAQYTVLDEMFQIKSAIKMNENRTATYHLGVSYFLSKQLDLRCGLNEWQPTYGLGLNLGFMQLDYAMITNTQYTELGNTHVFSINLDWGKI